VVAQIGRQHVKAGRQFTARGLPVPGGTEETVEHHEGRKARAAEVAVEKIHWQKW
jgi:hypothetical protein